MFRAMPRHIAHLIGHPAEVTIQCGCTRVIVVKPRWLIERLGLEATIEDGERVMICSKCAQRPRLVVKGEYAVTGGRDSRQDRPPMPGWVDLT